MSPLVSWIVLASVVYVVLTLVLLLFNHGAHRKGDPR